MTVKAVTFASHQGPVLDATLTTFKSEIDPVLVADGSAGKSAPQQVENSTTPVYLVVLLPATVRIYSPSGANTIVALPCRMAGFMPTPCGVILRRDPSVPRFSGSMYGSAPGATSSMTSLTSASSSVSGPDPLILPTIPAGHLHLPNPHSWTSTPDVDPPPPATLWSLLHPLDPVRPVGLDSSGAPSLFVDQSASLVYASADHPILMTWSADSQSHSMWLLRRSSSTETPPNPSSLPSSEPVITAVSAISPVPPPKLKTTAPTPTRTRETRSRRTRNSMDSLGSPIPLMWAPSSTPPRKPRKRLSSSSATEDALLGLTSPNRSSYTLPTSPKQQPDPLEQPFLASRWSPDVFLEPLWTSTTNSASKPATTVFVATSGAGSRPVLVTLIDGTLSALALTPTDAGDSFHVTTSWTIPGLVRAAVPLFAAFPSTLTSMALVPSDVLVAFADGTSVLYHGPEPLASVPLPPTETLRSIGTSRVALRAVGSDPDTPEQQYTLHGWPSEALPRHILGALSYVLPTKPYVALHRAVLQTPKASSIQGFSSLLLSVLSPPESSSTTGTPPMTPPATPTSAWEALMAFKAGPAPLPTPTATPELNQVRQALDPHVSDAIRVIALLYEDTKVSTLARSNRTSLGSLLASLAAAHGSHTMLDKLVRDGPPVSPLALAAQASMAPVPSAVTLDQESVLAEPPCIISWMEASLASVAPSSSIVGARRPGIALPTYPSMPTTPASTLITRLYTMLTSGGSPISARGLPPSTPAMNRPPASPAIAALPPSTPSSPFAPLSPSSTRRPVLGVTPLPSPSSASALSPIHAVVGEMAEAGLSVSAIAALSPAIAAPLVAALASVRPAPPPTWSPAAYNLMSREDLAILARPSSRHRPSVPPVPPSAPSSASQYATAPPGVDLPNPIHGLRWSSDARLREVQRLLASSRPRGVRTTPGSAEDTQTALVALAKQTLALPVGRGAFTAKTVAPLATEPVQIPMLSLAGRFSPSGAVVDLRAGKLSEAELWWPLFHNGVAAGLRLTPAAAPGVVTRRWILYNMPAAAAASPAHAGLLLGLGLSNGALSVLTLPDVFVTLDNLGYRDGGPAVLTAVGLILGLAAAKRGSGDPGLRRLIAIHTPSQLGLSISEIPVPLQTAAVAASGLLFAGKNDRRTAQALLTEIGQSPVSEDLGGREGYSLAAGIALGMVCVGKGDNAGDGEADGRFTEKLFAYTIAPGSPESGTAVGATDHKSQSVKPGPQGAGSGEGQNAAGPRPGDGISASAASVDVTAPGALLALSLIWHRTNNEQISARLALPEEPFALDYIRPDFVLMRVLGRGLIMWNSVRPDHEWVRSHMPSIVANALPPTPGLAHHMADFVLGDFGDVEALRLTALNAVGGACAAIGIRYAGSGSSSATQLLTDYLEWLLTVVGPAGSSRGGGAVKVPTASWEMVLGVVACSLGLVSAGTGSLEALRSLKRVRAVACGPEAGFGLHMAVSLALGFVFVGGGLSTMNTTPMGVAGLVAALYPHFPSSPDDNRYHLQALRHLWVLALVPRTLEVRDIDTGAALSVPLEFELSDGTKRNEASPTVLPCQEWLKAVRVVSSDHWPLRVKTEKLSVGPNGKVLVHVKAKQEDTGSVVEARLAKLVAQGEVPGLHGDLVQVIRLTRAWGAGGAALEGKLVAVENEWSGQDFDVEKPGQGSVLGRYLNAGEFPAEQGMASRFGAWLNWKGIPSRAVLDAARASVSEAKEGSLLAQDLGRGARLVVLGSMFGSCVSSSALQLMADHWTEL